MVRTANYLRNRSPVTSKSITPYEARIGAKPSFAHLWIIGTTGYAANRVPSTGYGKLKDQRTLCVLVGYEGNNIYRVECFTLIATLYAYLTMTGTEKSTHH